MTSRRRYVREARVVQCYKCQMYGHVAAKCQNSNSICSTCAGHHRAETCDKKEDRTAWRCAACARDGHRSTDHSCPARKQASREAKAKQRALEHQPNPVKTRTPTSSMLGRSQDGEGPRSDTTPGPGTTRRNPRKRTAVSPPVEENTASSALVVQTGLELEMADASEPEEGSEGSNLSQVTTRSGGNVIPTRRAAEAVNV